MVASSSYNYGGVAVLRQSKASAPNFQSFAQKIRQRTNDGWELIDAVYEVFCRARLAGAEGKAGADALILESATWLADRGFGKPVQVGQLLDDQGNAVAFTLWSPADNRSPDDIITMQNGKAVESEEMQAYLPPAQTLEPPKIKDLEKKDGFAYGPARAWGVGEVEPTGGR